MKTACLLISLIGYTQVPATIEYKDQPHHLYFKDDHTVLVDDETGCVSFQTYKLGRIKGDGFPWIEVKP